MPSLKNVLPAENNFTQIEEKFQEQSGIQSVYRHIRPVKINDKSTINKVPANMSSKTIEMSDVSFLTLFSAGYLIGIVILFVAFLTALWKTIRFINSTKKEYKEGIIYCHSENLANPFSFFNYLVADPTQHTPDEFRKIVTHEKYHITQFHSIDILLLRTVSCLLWINPLLPLVRRYLKLNLEYIADDQVLQTGIDKEAYQLTILQTCLKTQTFLLSNQFFSPKIKHRILMMNTEKTNKVNLLKYTLIFPFILASSFFLGSFTSKNKDRYMEQYSKLASQHPNEESLNQFAGYYVSDVIVPGEDHFLKMFIEDGHLSAMELWSGLIFKLNQEAEMKFNGQVRSYPIVFSKNKEGEILQANIYGDDIWKRIDNYKLPVKKEKVIAPARLQELKGYYASDTNSFAIIKVTVQANRLTLQPLWKENSKSYFAKSENEFLHVEKDCYGKISFTDGPTDGSIRLTEGNLAHFTKIKNYQPQAPINLNATQLKKFEGRYTIHWEGERFEDTIRFKATEAGLVFTKLYRPKQKGDILLAMSGNKFISSQNPFSMEFIEDNNGLVTNCTFRFPHEKNTWKKID